MIPSSSSLRAFSPISLAVSEIFINPRLLAAPLGEWANNLGAQMLHDAENEMFIEEDWVELERLKSYQLNLIENFGDSHLLFELASK